MLITPNILAESPYQSYVYSYPHKTAYRPINPPIPLKSLWAEEDKSTLFLYMHIPFCEMRCGFCNLFTTVHPQKSLETAYLDTLEVQARRVRDALGTASFARMAIGGGTPTYLTPDELIRLFSIAVNIMGVDLQQTPISVETSPLTSQTERLQVLHDHHVDRISIGVQSFFEAEVHAAGRAQKIADVHAAIERIRTVGFPTLNLDFIYGLPGQTVVTWLESLKTALNYQPEELYLYPLYVRPLTGMDKLDKEWDDIRLDCYRAGRDFLLENGYQQVSMRMFRAHHAPQNNGTVYCCQEDGMIGLGCGARSYTRNYHYSSEYAVGRHGILEILHDYIKRPAETFDNMDYGFYLNADDQRRRYILKSLLHSSGLSLPQYHAYFGTPALTDYRELSDLLAQDLVQCENNVMTLTPLGIERSDAIGPMLYSDHVRQLMKGYELE
jgi:oxygen-independent coproporphyrinogen III oxidase